MPPFKAAWCCQQVSGFRYAADMRRLVASGQCRGEVAALRWLDPEHLVSGSWPRCRLLGLTGMRFVGTGCEGTGRRHLSARLEIDLLEAGEVVVRVPPKLMAGQRRLARTGGKSDP